MRIKGKNLAGLVRRKVLAFGLAGVAAFGCVDYDEKTDSSYDLVEDVSNDNSLDENLNYNENSGQAIENDSSLNKNYNENAGASNENSDVKDFEVTDDNRKVEPNEELDPQAVCE